MKGHPARLAVALLGTALLASPLAARDATGPRRLQVLLVAGQGDPEGAAREQRLITELQLQLDTISVVVTPMADRGFEALAPSGQIAEAAAAAGRAGAEATVWVCAAGGGELEVRLVLRDGREALTRSADADAAPSPEAMLATAVWELLQAEGVPVEETNDAGPPAAPAAEDGPAVDAGTPEPEEDDDPVASPITWGIRAAIDSGGGIDSDTPAALLGGGAALELEIEESFFVAAGVFGLAEARAGRDGEMRVAARIEPRLEAGPVWRVGIARLAPFLRISVPFSWYRMALENREDFEIWYANGRFDLGLALSFGITRSLRFVASGGAGVNLIVERFERISGEGVERAPLFEWGASLGALLIL